MEINVADEKNNPFFKRKDVRLSIRHVGDPTPSKSDIVRELSGRYGVDELQVQINYIFSKKGLGESFVSAKILEEKPQVMQKEAKKKPPKTEEKEGGEETAEAQASEAA